MGIIFKKIITEEKILKDGIEYTVVLVNNDRVLVPTTELSVEEEDVSQYTFLKPGNYDISGI